jgi:hypothetical protein
MMLSSVLIESRRTFFRARVNVAVYSCVPNFDCSSVRVLSDMPKRFT